MFNFFKKLSKKKYKIYECVKNDETVIKHEMKGCEEQFYNFFLALWEIRSSYRMPSNCGAREES